MTLLYDTIHDMEGDGFYDVKNLASQIQNQLDPNEQYELLRFSVAQLLKNDDMRDETLFLLADIVAENL